VVVTVVLVVEEMAVVQVAVVVVVETAADVVMMTEVCKRPPAEIASCFIYPRGTFSLVQLCFTELGTE
jgi:hypothetical protein